MRRGHGRAGLSAPGWLKRGLRPPRALGEVPASRPEPGQRNGQPQGGRGVVLDRRTRALLAGPRDRAPDGQAGPTRPSRGVVRIGQREIEVPVRGGALPSRRRRRDAPARTGERSRAAGSGGRRPWLDLHERLVDELRQQVERGRGGQAVAVQIALHGLDEKLPANTPSRRSSTCSGSRQQVVAPVERGPQRLLAGQRRAAPAGQQPEAVVQPRGDLRRATGRAPGPPPARAPAACRPAGGRSRRRPAAFSASSAKPGAASPRARTNRRTALGALRAPPVGGSPSGPGSASDGTRQATSPAMPQRARGSWPGPAGCGQARSSALGQRARRRRSGARSCPAPAAAAARRSARPARRPGSRSRAQLHARAPSRPPAATSAGSASGASSTSQTPSAKSPARLARQLQRQPRLAAAARAGQRQQARCAPALAAARPARARGRRSWSAGAAVWCASSGHGAAAWPWRAGRTGSALAAEDLR